MWVLNMIKGILGKGLPVAVIILFLGLAIQPSVAVQPEQEIDVEPKDYLFQTIIDIANNPELKELLEQHKYDFFKVDIDRSVYRKLLIRNPRMFFNTLFTKPSLSIDYLNKCYNKGIEITNILGEDKVIEMIESIEVTDTRVFDELNNIISKDEELYNRLATLKEMNKELNSVVPLRNFTIICYYLNWLILPVGANLLIWALFFSANFPSKDLLVNIFFIIWGLKCIVIALPLAFLLTIFGCIEV